MTRDAFLQSLKETITGLPQTEIDEILSDYAAYFDDARAAGRAEADVAAMLGNPAQLGRELRTESGLRRFERRPSAANLILALFALAGLAVVDLIVLPFLLVFAAIALGLAALALLLALAGAGKILLLATAWPDASFIVLLGRFLIGVGLIAGAVGLGSLLLLGLSSGVRLLGEHARLHYRLLKPMPESAGRAR
ncbi:DUF1700 domain-containing protein [Labrys wisconsinensis]|uniref:Membrane protein n=1 Tax=Labrys wisconsinensis TaxID=425677 RepID=A0ABU0JGL2_9HYPH|nr:DUF1700 domain-containing protein [Labrys wisconsinensis]MDQ0472725.1 putative membrane protein [Labrys wisconsinensis]